MALSLLDTLSSRKLPLTPAEGDTLRLYVCGPTVYDFAHVGHARCYVVYDVLVRHLRATGRKVRYVRNITDVDDKILQRARERGETPTALAERFTAAFHEDLARLGCLSPDLEPRVTAHIPHIISLIERLLAKGAAYVSGSDVYFAVPSFTDYGKLSHRPPDSVQEGASGRISDEEARAKRHPADFALWKSADADAWGWPSPWGHGRPGWHIECSAMSMEHLGETLDLHGGGLNLVFPHHENEIAQSEGATGKTFSRHWMHNGFVEVDKTKMSKSLGNFFTARQIFERYEPEALRWAMLTVHYRSPLNLDWELDATNHVQGFPLFEECERKIEYLYTTKLRLAGVEREKLAPNGDPVQAVARFPLALADALDDDLNMPVALAETSELLKGVNELVDRARKKGAVAVSSIDAAERALAALTAELGVGAEDPATVLRRIRDRRASHRGILEADVEAAITARRAARDARDFAKADAIRADLTARGVELMDGPEGTTWRVV